MDINKNEALDDAVANAECELVEALKKYKEAFAQSANGNKGIPTIDQIEKIWSELDANTRKIFVNMLSDSINSTNESEMISSKKENTGKRG